MRPRIVIPANFREGSGDSSAQAFLNISYVHAVHQAGGVAVLVPPLESFSAEVAEAYQAEGVLLSGGGDLDPALYGQAPHPQLSQLTKRRQGAELGWFRWADRKHLPVLGVCLGCQVINVARGGSLIQFLPEVQGTTDHGEGGRSAYHDVSLVGPLLKEILGGREASQLNSRHRQAIDSPGQGLRVAARAVDGVIEAVEDVAGQFTLGVQWHPEDMPDSDVTRKLFAAFIDACRRR